MTVAHLRSVAHALLRAALALGPRLVLATSPPLTRVEGAVDAIRLGGSSDSWVRFAKRGVDLDPGGIAKGFAVDRITQILIDNCVEQGLVL